MLAPAAWHSLAVAIVSAIVTGTAGWSAFTLRAPFGAAMIIVGRVIVTLKKQYKPRQEKRMADRITEQTEDSRKSPASQSRKARKAVERRGRMDGRGLGELLKDTFDNTEGE